MTLDTYKFRDDGELRHVSTRMAHRLLLHTKKISSLLGFLITLLEVFNREVQRHRKLGYCDFEMALVCYKVGEVLCKECKKLEPSNELVIATKDTFERKHSDFAVVSKAIDSTTAPDRNQNSNGVEDDLLARFRNLKSPQSSSISLDTIDHTIPKLTNMPLIDYVKFKGEVTASELHELLMHSKVLLIDYRAAKDFNHNHINHTDIVNIEPSQVSNLVSQTPNSSDYDLERKLTHIIPDIQLERLKQRRSYDLVVLYNFNYGADFADDDRFDALTGHVLAGQSRANFPKTPFDTLIDILMFRNKTPGHALSRYPCYLVGGISHWFKAFGKDSIERTQVELVLQRPPASVSREASSKTIPHRLPSVRPEDAHSNSPYLRNFGDYLSTVKSGTSRPVEPLFSQVNIQSPAPDHVKAVLVSSQGRSSAEQTPKENRKPSFEGPPASVRSNSSLLSRKGTSASLDTTKFLEQYTTGLTNLGNSCYMNCILQCLGATPQLTGFFFPSLSTSASLQHSAVQSYRQHINVNNRLGTKGILTTNFVSLLKNMFGSTGTYFTPLEFKKVMGSLSPSKQFATFDQQDCIEFLDFLLDRLHEDLNQMVVSDPSEKRAISELTPEQEKTREILPVRLASTIEWERYLKLNFSIIVDFFQGQYSSRLRCIECGMTSTTFSAFLILSLPIPSRLGNTTSLLLDDCLKAFVTTELLDDDNKWFCPRCKRRTKLTKKMTITRLPQVLIVHFKRFQISASGHFSKLDTLITYPVNDVLDLTSYWPPVGTTLGDSLPTSEAMSIEREQQVLNTLPTRNQNPPFKYKLYGVANHYGNLTTGHYTSYVRKKSDTKKIREWCYFDDAKVTYNYKESQVMNKNAYCLFYQRV